MSANPYDQLPYRSQPIEWTAPERLALASLLHGGPVPDLRTCRVLELGCSDGSNLLPLAFYRPNATFVGIDGAASAITSAKQRQQALQLTNIEFLQADFLSVQSQLSGQFDFIIAHGVFSWVPDAVRDALFEVCREHLAADGLLYLNYNTQPGWNVRGMVRDYLLAQADDQLPLLQQALNAQQAAARMAQALATESHPYSQLMASEFQFVCDNHPSYIAHEFLAPHNRAYWRSDFLALASRFGLYAVADADYNYPSGRVNAALADQLQAQDLAGRSPMNTEDLLQYRQLHSPVLSKQSARTPFDAREWLPQLRVASCLQPVMGEQVDTAHACWFEHPNGFQVEAREHPMRDALQLLAPIWPASESVATLMGSNTDAMADLLLLHNHGLLELRLPDAPNVTALAPNKTLNRLEVEWGGYYTTANHLRMDDPASNHSGSQS